MSPRLSSKLKVEEEVEDTDPTVASVMTSGNSSFIRRRFFPRVNSDESLNPPNVSSFTSVFLCPDNRSSNTLTPEQPLLLAPAALHLSRPSIDPAFSGHSV